VVNTLVNAKCHSLLPFWLPRAGHVKYSGSYMSSIPCWQSSLQDSNKEHSFSLINIKMLMHTVWCKYL